MSITKADTHIRVPRDVKKILAEILPMYKAKHGSEPSSGAMVETALRYYKARHLDDVNTLATQHSLIPKKHPSRSRPKARKLAKKRTRRVK